MKDFKLTKDNFLEFINDLTKQIEDNNEVIVDVRTPRTRTITQNSSIHKYCQILSDKFNEAGLDMQTVLAEGTSIPWSESKVKEDIWRTVQIALTGKESTKDLNTDEVSKVYDVVNRHLSQTFGVSVQFPSRDNYENISSR